MNSNDLDKFENNKNEKIKLLISDDSEIIAKKIENILEKDDKIELLGIANNGVEEYEKIIELKPQLVITDNQMPKLNGIDVIEKVYNSTIENKLKPRFILITADFLDYELRSRASKFNVLQILKKPIDEEEIMNAIDEFIIEKDNENIPKEVSMIEIKNKVSFWRKILNFFGIN